jgi:hypothetical protein
MPLRWRRRPRRSPPLVRWRKRRQQARRQRQVPA